MGWQARAIRSRVAFFALCALCVLPANASAETAANITVAFSPNRAGAATTLTITAAFTTSKSDGVPAPIRKSVTHLPPGIEVDLTGLTTCSLAKLELEEPHAGACPESSLLGSGTTFAEADLGLEPIQEHAPVTAVLGSSRPGRTLIYLDGEGTYPVTEQVIARAVLSGNASSGQTFTITVPPIETTVGGPNASVVNFMMKLGPQAVLALDRHRRGKATLARGIVLPKSCHGKLAFPTKLFFADHTTFSTTPTSPCPRH